MNVWFNKKRFKIEIFLTQINKKIQSNISIMYNKEKCYIIDRSHNKIQVQINQIHATKNTFWNIKVGDSIRIINQKNVFEGVIISSCAVGTDTITKSDDVKLPFCFPRIKTYPFYTALVATLDSYNVADNWIYNNYILIWMLGWTHFLDYWADFKYGDEENQEAFCKLINKEIVSREKIKKKYRTIIQFIKESIKEKKYVFTGVDIFFIQEWWNNEKEHYHYRHQAYVYGYNEEKQYIIMSDFIGGDYKSINVPFEQFIEAYNNYDKVPVIYVEYGQEIWLISYNKNKTEEIDLDRIVNLLEDFLNSRDTKVKSYLWHAKTVSDIKFGLEYYDEILKAICEQRNGIIDYRAIHILVELNIIMRDRMQYLEKNMNIDFTNLCKTNLDSLILEVKKAQKLVLKYNITLSDKDFKKLMKCLVALKEEQKNTFSMCLECIKKLNK